MKNTIGANMNINIYTFQNAINIGAFLQGYALKSLLENQGYKCNFPFKFNIYNQRFDIIAKRFSKFSFNIIRYRKFLKEQKNFNNKNYSENEIAIIGSDSIWDVSEKTSGYIPSMFGVGLKEKKIISYAASFGTMTDFNLLPEEAILGLSKFKNLSVRDKNSQSIIESLGLKSQIVADPTLLYDYDGIRVNPSVENDYIMVYGGFSKSRINEILDIKHKYNLPLYSVGTFNPWCDKSFAVSPSEFIGYVAKAKYIITSMYHGSLFAMKYNIPFVSVFSEKRITKANTTFEILGVSNRVLVDSEHTYICDVLSKNIDFEDLNNRIMTFRGESINYLISSINSN